MFSGCSFFKGWVSRLPELLRTFSSPSSRQLKDRESLYGLAEAGARARRGIMGVLVRRQLVLRRWGGLQCFARRKTCCGLKRTVCSAVSCAGVGHTPDWRKRVKTDHSILCVKSKVLILDRSGAAERHSWSSRLSFRQLSQRSR